MALRLARRLARGIAFLDPVSDRLQAAVRDVPKPLRDVLDGVWFGAPLHPALTDVPLGSWTAATAFDAVDALTGGDSLATAADATLAVGVLAALPTAATGLNDWGYLRGDSRRIGTLHAILNTGALALNLASLVLRRRGRRERARALSLAAYGGSLASAHLGGLLSFGLGVRVNHTAFESHEQEWRAVADEASLKGDELLRVEVDGAPAVVTRAGGRICAIAARCTHLGGPLDRGTRRGDVVTCPWHGSEFDLCTGNVVAGPAVFPQPAYDVRVEGGRIELRPR